MIQITTYTHQQLPAQVMQEEIASFLFKHLETYGDPESDIRKAMDYALQKDQKPGGLISVATVNNEIAAAVVINKTGMTGYIPDNILVYIATHNEHRGKGIGKQLMQSVIAESEGDIALHVEPENPARRLYEQLGFTNKYLEMRLKK